MLNPEYSKYSLFSFTPNKQKKLKIFFNENFNISTNNIISVKVAHGNMV
jgi:hypothetical protein